MPLISTIATEFYRTFGYPCQSGHKQEVEYLNNISHIEEL